MVKIAKVPTSIRLHPDTIAGIDEVRKELHLSRANYIQMTLANHLKKLKEQPDRTISDVPEYSSK